MNATAPHEPEGRFMVEPFVLASIFEATSTRPRSVDH